MRKTIGMIHNSRVTVSLATVDDYEELMGSSPAYTFKGISFFLDGVLAGIGGVQYIKQCPVVFSNIKEGVKVNKATIYRCALEIMKLAKTLGVPVYAFADRKIITSERLLSKLGFVHVGTDTVGEVYKYG